jgi:hypothetical protein
MRSVVAAEYVTLDGVTSRIDAGGAAGAGNN